MVGKCEERSLKSNCNVEGNGRGLRRPSLSSSSPANPSTLRFRVRCVFEQNYSCDVIVAREKTPAFHNLATFCHKLHIFSTVSGKNKSSLDNLATTPSELLQLYKGVSVDSNFKKQQPKRPLRATDQQLQDDGFSRLWTIMSGRESFALPTNDDKQCWSFKPFTPKVDKPNRRQKVNLELFFEFFFASQRCRRNAFEFLQQEE